jgi:tRNA1(Val) A37 N6-methylase TrmN6
MLGVKQANGAMSLDHATPIVKYQTPTRDAFLAGRVIITQPRQGFRAGLDSVLLGAAVRHKAGDLLDLGAGVGTAAIVALCHAPAASNAVLVENDPALVELATGNLAANGFAGRARALPLDVAASGAERGAVGLATDAFASVIANPPYFVTGQGTSAATRGRAARHMPASALDLWVRTAAASAAPDGEIVFIMPAEMLGPLLAAFEERFGALTLLPFAPRPGAAANRVLLRGIKGSRAPLTLLSTRFVHGDEGTAFSPEIEAVLRGETRLVW